MDDGAKCAFHAGNPSPHLLQMINEIQTRLAPICADTPLALFDEMVLRIAVVRYKYEQLPL